MSTDAILPPNEPVASPQPAPKPSTLRRIFVGQEGLRAIWSVLLFIIIFAGLVNAVLGALLFALCSSLFHLTKSLHSTPR